MAFDLDNFDKLSQAGLTQMLILWGYVSADDTIATIETANYFDSVADRLSIGDYIYLRGSDGSDLVGVTAISPHVTVAPNPDVVTPGSIVNADINAAAAIAFSKLAALPSGQILVGSAGTVPTAVAMSGDATIIASGALTIANSAITNAKVSASAGIAFSKMEALASGSIIVGSVGTVPTAVVMSGDATIVASGALTIANSAITNAKVSASAAIAFSKLATLTDAHILVGSGAGVATDVAVSGDLTLANTGAFSITGTRLKYTTVAITAAEFNGMYATPKLLVAAPGANRLLVLDKVNLLMTYVSANYAAGGVAAVQYDSTANGAGVIASTTLAAATFQAAASTGFMFNTGVVAQTFTTCVNKGLYLSNITGAFTTGDSTFVAHIWYKDIPTV